MSIIKIEVNNNSISCEVSILIDKFLSPEHFPLKFKVYPLIGDKILYECDLHGGMWASYPEYRDINAKIYTNDGILLKDFKYSYEQEDLVLYEFWDYFCKTNKDSVGLIIGSGNGEWGEWVNGVNDNKIDCHLVEASFSVFKELEENYKNLFYIKLYNLVISKDGLDSNFYDVDDGLSTINVEYLEKIVGNKIDQKFEIRKTKKINDFLNEIGKIDWIRFDVEGIDYDLVTTINQEYFSNLKMIQYEHMNLEPEKQKIVEDIFINRGFRKIVFSIDTIFIK